MLLVFSNIESDLNQKLRYKAAKVSKAQKNLGSKGPKECKPNIAIDFKVKFIYNDIKVMHF